MSLNIYLEQARKNKVGKPLVANRNENENDVTKCD